MKWTKKRGSRFNSCIVMFRSCIEAKFALPAHGQPLLGKLRDDALAKQQLGRFGQNISVDFLHLEIQVNLLLERVPHLQRTCADPTPDRYAYPPALAQSPCLFLIDGRFFAMDCPSQSRHLHLLLRSARAPARCRNCLGLDSPLRVRLEQKLGCFSARAKA